MSPRAVQRAVVALVIVAGLMVGWLAWQKVRPAGVPEGFVNGNGRIEATEINVSTKLAGRVEEMLVDEGDFVEAGKPLVRMQTDELEARRAEAVAQLQQARQSVATAKAQTAMRQSDLAAAQAVVAQREGDLNFARRDLTRLERLGTAAAEKEVDQARTNSIVAESALNAAKAQATAAQAAIEAAQAERAGAESTVAAREATVRRIDADIKDSVLFSPRDGRVQYRIAQPGEVLPPGGKVLNVIDLGDVYMTFFLPETTVGRVAMGTEARLVLDAAPQYVIPASVSFVASTAQFTPKTVETAEERQKLMFRVRAKIAPELLKKHLQQVKTGLPGVAWVRLDPKAPWPKFLEIRVPE
jgi:HlyD family secretion protein